jgi:hypothetical protein
MNDIVTRLRRDCMSLIADEAADEIERLRQELQECEDLLDRYQREDADRTRWENI